MMPSYNLIDEPWLPCTDLHGRARKVGIQEALISAHEFREIASPEAPVVPAIHRLLLAILHRVFGPEDRGTWTRMWTRGAFDKDTIESYLRQWRRRFDLFDEERPFYQVPGKVKEVHWAEPTRLIPFRASGNNATLFDHTSQENERTLNADEAARWLIATQGFDVPGRITHDEGATSAVSTPLLNKLVFIATGGTLFETLLLNMVRYDPEDAAPFEMSGHDAPAWEQPEPAVRSTRAPRGYLDLLTWQARRLRLHPLVDESGAIKVDKVVRMDGLRFPKELDERTYETMCAYLDQPEAGKGEAPYRNVVPRLGRSLWRDSHAALGAADTEGRRNYRRPQTLDWIAGLAARGIVPRSARFRLSAYALANDKASVTDWVQDRLPLPVAYLDDENRENLDTLRQGLGRAERIALALYSATVHLAEELLCGDQPNAGDREINHRDKKAVGELARSFATEVSYWPRLDVPFRRFMAELPADDSEEHRKACMERWSNAAVQAARDSLARAIAQAGPFPRAMAASAKAQRLFRLRLRRITENKEEALNAGTA